MPIVTAIEKQKLISSTAKNVAAGIPLGLSLDDSDGHREAAEFIAKLTRFGMHMQVLQFFMTVFNLA